MRLPIRQYRFRFRNAYLQIAEPNLQIVIPVFFGRQVWEVPLSQILFCDMTMEVDGDGQPAWMFEPPLKIPSLFPPGRLTRPTLQLLFRTPQRMPKLTWRGARSPSQLPFTRKQTRSEAGNWVDGILLRMQHNATAVSVLAETGIARTQQPSRWLILNRTPLTDPDRIERFQSIERNIGWAGRVMWLSVAAYVAALIAVVGHRESGFLWGEVIPLLLPYAVAFLAGRVGRRLRSRLQGN